ncbi:hypothetical protein NM688_g3519 [Phlebia brevispora]|uniref:Uncharacterized protein n=1 Tax=Phlebia brevispora TaxID=194682 RepID=A0ACC1T5Q2_9APHY|nr:hypothetical protein NM688_g3519 [Phlebia brevispora]
MSATSSDSAAIAAYKSNLVYNHCANATLTVVSYEFVITFQREYECHDFSLTFFISVLDALPQIIVAVFSALRIFALLGGTYMTAVFTLVLGVVPVALDLQYDAFILLQNHRKLIYLPVDLAAVLCSIAADFIAIMITWIKTYRHVREASSLGISAGFGATLIRYGTLYFIVLFVVNLVNGLITLVPSLQLNNPTGIFLATLPNVILSRFLVNLHQVDYPDTGSTVRFSNFSIPNFRMPTILTIIGNLGEPLAIREETPDDEAHDNEKPAGDRANTSTSSAKGEMIPYAVDSEGSAA